MTHDQRFRKPPAVSPETDPLARSESLADPGRTETPQETPNTEGSGDTSGHSGDTHVYLVVRDGIDGDEVVGAFRGVRRAREYAHWCAGCEAATQPDFPAGFGVHHVPLDAELMALSFAVGLNWADHPCIIGPIRFTRTADGRSEVREIDSKLYHGDEYADLPPSKTAHFVVMCHAVAQGLDMVRSYIRTHYGAFLEDIDQARRDIALAERSGRGRGRKS